MRKKFIILIGFLSVLWTAGRGQEQGLTLEEAVAAALKNNPEIVMAQREVDASRARLLQSEALPNPDVVLSNEALPWSFRGGETEINLGIRQLFEFPGKRSLRKAIGKTGEEIALADLERVRLSVAFRVKKAYVQAAFSQRVADHLRSLLDVMDQYREMADIRYRAGEVAAADVFRGRLESLKVQNEIIEAGRAWRADLLSLRLLMGMDPSIPLRLTGELSYTPLVASVEDLKRQAEARPLLLSLKLEAERAKTGVKLARKNFYPDFRLGFYYPSKRISAWGFEVESSIPIFRKKQTGEVLEAEALQHERLIALEARRMRIMTLIESYYSDAKAAEERLALFEKSLLREAEEMLLAAIGQYRYGRTDSLNVFDIYRIFKETRLEHLRTLLNYRLSLAELETAGEEE